MISAARRAKAIGLIDRIEGSCLILRNKLVVHPLDIVKLEDIKEQLATARADIEHVESIIRSAIWKTTTRPEKRKEGAA